MNLNKNAFKCKDPHDMEWDRTIRSHFIKKYFSLILRDFDEKLRNKSYLFFCMEKNRKKRTNETRNRRCETSICIIWGSNCISENETHARARSRYDDFIRIKRETATKKWNDYVLRTSNDKHSKYSVVFRLLLLFLFLMRHVRATAPPVRFCACILHVYARQICVLGLRAQLLLHLVADSRNRTLIHPFTATRSN